jgi:hypothetical protein
MTEWFPKKPQVDVGPGDLLAIFTAHNEAHRIPYFLEYYRSHGVDKFFAIDNRSTDNSADLLLAQPDVVYFYTDASYIESAAGRLWTSELARYYSMDKWCLTLDLDEILVFPMSELITIKNLTRYLEKLNYDGVFTVFLDMYGEGRLSEAVCPPGTPFLDVCNYYEVATYTLNRPMNFPLIQVFGGPRQRAFWADGKSGQGPSMRKIPLVKWDSTTAYIFSTHSTKPLRLADITAATLHFKFVATFKSLVEREVERGDRPQAAHYRAYADLLSVEDPSFVNPASRQWRGTEGLVEEGAMVFTKQFARFAEMERGGSTIATRKAQRFRDAAASAEERATIRLEQLPLIWPLINRDSSWRLLDARGTCIIAEFAEAIADHKSTLFAVSASGHRLASAAALSPTKKLIGIGENQSRRLVKLEVPETLLRETGAAFVYILQEPQGRILATVQFESASHVDEKLRGICFNSKGPQLVCRIDGENDRVRSSDVVVYVDGRFSGTVSLASTRIIEGGNNLCTKFIRLNLSEILLDAETAQVEVYFARTPFRFIKSPMIYCDGEFKSLLEVKRAAKYPST